jgi:hypothetical protein
VAKKKSARTRGKTEAAQHDRRRQRLEERRQARERELARQARARRQRDFLRRTVLALILGALTWLLFFRNQAPTEIRGVEVMSFSSSGVNVHRTGTLDYATTPPVSGPHAPQPAACGTHAGPIPDEQLVHTLEHGAVGILYRPDLDPQQITEVEALVARYDSHVFSAPYPGMQPSLVVASWAKKMELDSASLGTIRDYIEAFRQKGPERQDCPNSEDARFEP